MLANSDGFIIALLLTIAIEIIVAVFFGYSKKIEIITIIFINLITNPLLNYLLSVNNYFKIIPVNTSIILLLELFVIIIEFLLLSFALQQDLKKLFKLSLVMNIFSYIAGLLIFK